MRATRASDGGTIEVVIPGAQHMRLHEPTLQSNENHLLGPKCRLPTTGGILASLAAKTVLKVFALSAEDAGDSPRDSGIAQYLRWDARSMSTSTRLER